MDKADIAQTPSFVSSTGDNSASVQNIAKAVFRLSDFHYDLPDELIAQAPLAARSDSRLMVVDGRVDSPADARDPASQAIQHLSVRDLPRLLRTGDHLVFNNTRVIPARLFGAKATGGRLEMMLERVTGEGRVLAKLRASKSPRLGSIIILSGRESGSAEPLRCEARVIGRQDDLFELEAVDGDSASLIRFIEQEGEIPLPPYIERAPEEADKERYQTVFAESPGAVAAPTAGLHFDEDLLQALSDAGITHSFITLHVGAGTFQPVRVENPAEHVMHAERVTVDASTVRTIDTARANGGRIIAVGTTCVRALEAAAAKTGKLAPFEGETRLFLVPGATFNVVDAMVTNFHLPESTLLMLVASFTGLSTIMQAYQVAVLERYRFFSYGDAMLVWPQRGVRA